MRQVCEVLGSEEMKFVVCGGRGAHSIALPTLSKRVRDVVSRRFLGSRGYHAGYMRHGWVAKCAYNDFLNAYNLLFMSFLCAKIES